MLQWGRRVNTVPLATLIGSGVSYPANLNPVSVVIGEFDGDGNPDLAVANNGSGDITVLLGVGDGTFALAQPLALGSNPSSLTVDDLNGDCRPDLAAVSADGKIRVLLNSSH